MHIRVHSANGRTSCAPCCALFLRTLAAPQGPPVGRHPAAEATARAKARARAGFPLLNLEAVQGCTDSWIKGAVRSAEHRSPRRKMPAGARRWIAALAKQYMDVLSEQAGAGEKHRGFCRARCAAKHCARCLAFLVTFWAMPKSNRLAAGETKLCTSRNKPISRWIPACARMTTRETPSPPTSP